MATKTQDTVSIPENPTRSSFLSQPRAKAVIDKLLSSAVTATTDIDCAATPAETLDPRAIGVSKLTGRNSAVSMHATQQAIDITALQFVRVGIVDSFMFLYKHCHRDDKSGGLSCYKSRSRKSRRIASFERCTDTRLSQRRKTWTFLAGMLLESVLNTGVHASLTVTGQRVIGANRSTGIVGI